LISNALVAWVNRRHALLTVTIDPLSGLGTRVDFKTKKRCAR